MARLSRKMNGSTLVEILLAMVIISAVFVAGNMIFSQLLATTFDDNELRAKAIIDEQLSNLNEQERIESYKLDTLQLEISFEVKHNQHDYHVLATAVNQKGKLLMQTERIFFK